jgi:hypothetical protein
VSSLTCCWSRINDLIASFPSSSRHVSVNAERFSKMAFLSFFEIGFPRLTSGMYSMVLSKTASSSYFLLPIWADADDDVVGATSQALPRSGE